MKEVEGADKSEEGESHLGKEASAEDWVTLEKLENKPGANKLWSVR